MACRRPAGKFFRGIFVQFHNFFSLADVVKLVQAAEMGKSTHKQLSNAGGICRLSDHQKAKLKADWEGKEVRQQVWQQTKFGGRNRR